MMLWRFRMALPARMFSRRLKRLDAGVEHGFGPSLKYDLVFEGHRYPPKAVVGLAAQRLAGRVLDPGDFSGGQDSKSTHILQDLGFVVEPKSGGHRGA